MKKIIKDFNSKEIKRYFLVILLCFILDISVLYLLTEYGILHYLYSSIISLVFSFYIGYVLNIKWVFKKRKYKTKLLKENIIFFIITLFVNSINIILIWILSEIFSIYYIESKIISSAATFLFKFFLRKHFLFTS